MKIVITGGAGFIASQIADSYIKLGHKVVIIDNLSTGNLKFINESAKFYNADVRNTKEIERIIESEKPDIINHHAAQISVVDSIKNPLKDAEINLLGLINIIETARKNSIKKIIFASSGGVIYGNTNNIPTGEDCLSKPLSPYGITKLTGEYYLHSCFKNYRMPYIALRYANIYGPRQNPSGEAGVVAKFMVNFLTNKNPVINGDGKQTRDYLNVSDAVHANNLALQSSETGEFNIGTGIETNVLEIYAQIKSIVGSNLDATYAPKRKGELKRSCLTISKAAKKLGWKPKIKLYDGLLKTAEYFKKICQ